MEPIKGLVNVSFDGKMTLQQNRKYWGGGERFQGFPKKFLENFLLSLLQHPLPPPLKFLGFQQHENMSAVHQIISGGNHCPTSSGAR